MYYAPENAPTIFLTAPPIEGCGVETSAEPGGTPTPTPTPPPTCSNVQQLQANGMYMMSEQGDPVCLGDDVPRPDPAETCSGVVNGDNINVRSEPIQTGQLVGQLNTGVVVVAAEKRFNAAENRYWYLIDSEVDGYIAGEYVTLADPDCNLPLVASDENGTYQDIPPQPDSNLSNMCSGFFVFDEGQTLELYQQPDAASPVTFSVPDLSTVYIGAATTSADDTIWYFVKYIERYLLDEANNGEWRFYLYSGWINRFDTTLDEGCENLPAPTVDEYGNLIADITITKALENPTVPRHVGDIVSFTLTVQNNEAVSINGISVTDQLPAGLAFESADQTTFSSETGEWSLGSLEPATSAILHLTVRVAIPEQIPDIFEDAYKNTATLHIDNSALMVNSDNAEQHVQVAPALCRIVGQNNALPFRAPIRGNPAVPRTSDDATNLANAVRALGSDVIADAFSNDPVIVGLQWVHVYDPTLISAEPLADGIPLINNWLQVNTTFSPNGYSGSVGLNPNQAELDRFNDCLNSQRLYN